MTPIDPKMNVRRMFWQSGNVKLFAVTSLAAFPVIAAMYFNHQVGNWARPKLLELREAILGRPDYENADLRRGLGLESRVHPDKARNIFYYSNGKVPGAPGEPVVPRPSEASEPAAPR